jgi:HAD superfamily hydrolase (TIGR01509 family)
LYKAVIFDIDGTLVDSNDAHARAWVEAFDEFGHRIEFERVRPLIGMGGDKLMPQLTGIYPWSSDGKALSERRSEIFKTRYLPDLQPTRGAHRLLEWLRDENLTLLVATSANADEVEELLRIANGTKLFEARSSKDDVDRSKPDPDIVEAALARGECDPIDAVMVGDTPYDIEAAQRAGVGVIALRCGGWWDDAALGGALAIYDDPEDLLQQFDLSPFKRPLPVRTR